MSVDINTFDFSVVILISLVSYCFAVTFNVTVAMYAVVPYWGYWGSTIGGNLGSGPNVDALALPSNRPAVVRG